MSHNLLQRLIRRAHVRWHLRRSVGGLLSRQDDHLLNDIGLTRYQAEQLVAEAPLDDMTADGPLQVRAVTCAPGREC
jgi:uncharacterized protein YjiS (DUF1127 family)